MTRRIRIVLGIALVAVAIGSRTSARWAPGTCPDCDCDNLLFSPDYHGTWEGPICEPPSGFPSHCHAGGSHGAHHECRWDL
jgi:hypothetical protein